MNSIEYLWSCFWKRSKNITGQVEPLSPFKAANDLNNLEARLPKRKLMKLCENSSGLEFIKSADQHLYQVLVDFLIANVLKPIPSPLTQAIRTFAKNLEAKMKESLGSDYSAGLKRAKVSCLNKLMTSE